MPGASAAAPLAAATPSALSGRMLRFILLAFVALSLITLVTRNRTLRRAVYVSLALMALYAVLKLTGVIDALAPDRNGVL